MGGNDTASKTAGPGREALAEVQAGAAEGPLARPRPPLREVVLGTEGEEEDGSTGVWGGPKGEIKNNWAGKKARIGQPDLPYFIDDSAGSQTKAKHLVDLQKNN